MDRYAHCGFTGPARLGVCFKSSGGGGTQTQTSKTEMPVWVDKQAQGNLAEANKVAENLAGPYEGNRVAGMTPGMQQMIDQLQGNIGSTDQAYSDAAGVTNGLSRFDPGSVSPTMLRDTDLTPYLNPWSKAVIDPTMQIMEQSRRQALGQVGDQATQAKAFGGSRQAIAEGVTNAQSELQKGQFVGQLQGQNFAQAQAAARGDISQDYAAQVANLGARMQGAQFQGTMAAQLGDLASNKQSNFLNGMQAAMQGQGMVQSEEQKKLDAMLALYNERRQMPLDQLAIRQNALSNTPYGQTVTTTKPGPTEDVGGKVLGGASAAVGIAGSIMAMT